MQALQIRGQLDAIGHDRRVRLELGDETSRAYRAQRRDIGDIAFIDETLRTSSVATGSPATSTCASIFDPSTSVNTTTPDTRGAGSPLARCRSSGRTPSATVFPK
jgi:hypothetical protein